MRARLQTTRVALALVALTGVAHADMDAADVLQRVEATYQKPQHLTAAFEQTTTNAMIGKVEKSTGTFAVTKPDKIRFNYFKKGSKTELKHFFLFDGKVGTPRSCSPSTAKATASRER